MASGSLAAYLRVDVTGPEDLRALVDLATQRFGHLDVVAARSSPSRALTWWPAASWARASASVRCAVAARCSYQLS